MSISHELDAALATIDHPVAPRAPFADALLDRCLDELRPQAPRARLRRRHVALAIAVLCLVLAAAATATYLATRSTRAAPPSGAAELTVIRSLNSNSGSGVAAIAAVGPHGALRTLWRCPERGVFCGDLTSIAWSPDGKRLAFTLDELGGMSGYVGLHIVTVATGADLHLPSLLISHISRPQPSGFFPRYRQAALRQLGCLLPSGVAWAPDGKRLAYTCGSLHVIRADGTGRIAVPTGTASAVWPSWSPDGKRIAFATQVSPIVRNHHRVVARSSVFTVALDGTGRTLVARSASAPSWSPDGSTIAYWSSCHGVRLATPEGADATPGATPAAQCAVIGPHPGPAVPVWSPDGSALAIATPKGVYVTAADGSGSRKVTREASLGIFGNGRPAWTPGTGVGPRLLQRQKGGL
ncbi:MAG: hypothetical protein ABI990_05665 [Actinomycetota bacterium]